MADDDTTGDAGKPDDSGSLDTRMDRLESTQAEQGSKLDQIVSLLSGKGDDAGAGQDDGAAAPDVQSQVRAEIAATKEREAAEAREKGQAEWMESVNKQLEELKPEKTPRAPQTGWRGRLQSAMFGRPD